MTSDRRKVPAPTVLPDHSALLASLSAITTQLTSSRFQEALGRENGSVLDVAPSLVLRQLQQRGAMRPSELAEEITTGRSNISKIVKKLESDGLVEKDSDATDLRATKIRLTAAGVHRAASIHAAGDAMIARVTRNWADEDLALLQRLTSRLSADVAAFVAEVELLDAQHTEPRIE